MVLCSACPPLSRLAELLSFKSLELLPAALGIDGLQLKAVRLAGQNYTLVVAPPASGSSSLTTFLVSGC